jgi:hypothetical protein
MKVLITGMASSHCKRPSNTSFFTLLADAVSGIADVTWASPELSWTKKDLDAYDAILFGFIPPTSLSANKVFGAMHLLSLMFDSPKLSIVVDSAQMWQYKNSIQAVKRDPDILFGSFYSKREGYLAAKDHKESVYRTVEFFSQDRWPTTIYPWMPWITDEKVESILGFLPEGQLTGLNLDSLLIKPEPARIGRSDTWAVENPKNTWVDSIAKTLSFPLIHTKMGRKTDDAYALSIVRNSVGLLIPPQERKVGSWWNYRVVQASSTSTPISTHWQDTYKFNNSWAVLPYQVEDMSPAERQHLAKTQRDAYLNAIPKPKNAVDRLISSLLDSEKERI